MKDLVRIALSLYLIASALAINVRAENWPGWRGPRGDGSSTEQNIPTRWSETENLAWKVPVPGTGHSSPIVWGDRIFLTTCIEEEQRRELLCIDRTSGRTLWSKTVLQSPLEKKHVLNSFASSTPATDGELVYVTFLAAERSDTNEATPGDMVVAAYDFDGNQRWTVRPGRFSSVHGYCSCPVLFEDMLIVNGDHDGDSYLLALKKATGETVWKVPRENKTRSYSTPIIREIDGRTQMVLSGNKCVASYDPRDGSRHWIIDGPTEQFVATMVYGSGLFFMTAGFPEYHMLAIKPDGHGNVTDTHIAWRTKEACSYVPSPIAAGDYFLITSDGGIASCFEATTGERHWKQRLGKHYSGSPVLAEGLVYFTADDGITKVVKPGERFDVVSENHLNDAFFSSPAISKRQIIMRGEKYLYAIGGAALSE